MWRRAVLRTVASVSEERAVSMLSVEEYPK
jgi:hypothetical protein